MNINITRIILLVIVIVTGLVILLGYFVQNPLLSDIRTVFLNWGVILIAVALLVGLINLILVHVRKIIAIQSGYIYSIVLLLALLVTIIAGIVSGPTGKWSLWIFNYIQVPIETSLLAIIAIILIYASARLLDRRPGWFSVVLVITTLIFLLGSVTFPWFENTLMNELRSWFAVVPVTAGIRGILIGIALGVIATGLRVLMGADRPYES